MASWLSPPTPISSGPVWGLVDQHDAAIWEATKAMVLAITLATAKERRRRQAELVPGPLCNCPDDDLEACIEGTVYGPCTEDNCGGVCVSEGTCDCRADEHKPGRHGEPW